MKYSIIAVAIGDAFFVKLKKIKRMNINSTFCRYRSVSPDLDSKCLKKVIFEISQPTTKNMKNYPACKKKKKRFKILNSDNQEKHKI